MSGAAPPPQARPARAIARWTRGLSGGFTSGFGVLVMR